MKPIPERNLESIYANLGASYTAIEKIEKSLDCFIEAIYYCEQNGNESGVLSTYEKMVDDMFSKLSPFEKIEFTGKCLLKKGKSKMYKIFKF